ncbi:MAG TPA: DegT/DnrJ/EryC1/StrS family aminotransferase [Acidimicrobiales bacterium]|nr:DegT/DnrJ/EryC1/StrS family aminotransferase [Acidimicrobiales bacterium]
MAGATLALLGGPPAVTEPTDFTWPPITPADVAAVTALLERGELSYYGREGEVEALESAFSSHVGSDFALACSSGTAALHSAYFGLGLEPGDEVICPTFTFLSTVMPLFVVNAVPVLVDAEPDTGNIDPAGIEAAITPRTRAVVVVHLNGHACDMAPVVELCRRRGLRLVEDASHAHGATYDHAMVGSVGDVSVFSLQGAKLTAAGQGGILLTSDREIFERAVLLGHFRNRAFDDVESDRYRPFATTGYGLNYRMHPLAAALARRQFEDLEVYLAGRQANLGALSKGLAGIPGVEPPVVRPYATRHSWFNYKPLYDGAAMGGLPRARYLAALQAEGVPVGDSTSIPLHCEPLFQTLDDGSLAYGRQPNRRVYATGDLPNAESYAERALRLPTYTEPRPRLVEQLVEAFDKVARNRDALLGLR